MVEKKGEFVWQSSKATIYSYDIFSTNEKNQEYLAYTLSCRIDQEKRASVRLFKYKENKKGLVFRSPLSKINYKFVTAKIQQKALGFESHVQKIVSDWKEMITKDPSELQKVQSSVIKSYYENENYRGTFYYQPQAAYLKLDVVLDNKVWTYTAKDLKGLLKLIPQNQASSLTAIITDIQNITTNQISSLPPHLQAQENPDRIPHQIGDNNNNQLEKKKVKTLSGFFAKQTSNRLSDIIKTIIQSIPTDLSNSAVYQKTQALLTLAETIRSSVINNSDTEGLKIGKLNLLCNFLPYELFEIAKEADSPMGNKLYHFLMETIYLLLNVDSKSIPSIEAYSVMKLTTQMAKRNKTKEEMTDLQECKNNIVTKFEKGFKNEFDNYTSQIAKIKSPDVITAVYSKQF